MKYLLLLAIISISMCIGLPLPGIPQPGSIIVQENPYIHLNIQTIPTEVKSGRSVTLLFEAINNNDYDLSSVTVNAYDTCIFSGQSTENFDLRANGTRTWSWQWQTGETILEKDCEVKINIVYDATATIYQDIAVLSQSEYVAREMRGTLRSIPVRYYSSKSPLDIRLTFPESQPFLENTQDYVMYIDYYNIGGGFVDVNSGAITINPPGNIQSLECEEYGGLTLNEDLTFIRNKAQRSTCFFDIGSAGEPIDIRSMSITANYNYVIDTSVIINVKPARDLDSGTSALTCSDIGGLCLEKCAGVYGGDCVGTYDCRLSCCCVIPEESTEGETPEGESGTCGNGVCDSDENCATCGSDCPCSAGAPVCCPRGICRVSIDSCVL